MKIIIVLISSLILTACNVHLKNTQLQSSFNKEELAWLKAATLAQQKCGYIKGGNIKRGKAYTQRKCMDNIIDTEITSVAVYPELLEPIRKQVLVYSVY